MSNTANATPGAAAITSTFLLGLRCSVFSFIFVLYTVIRFYPFLPCRFNLFSNYEFECTFDIFGLFLAVATSTIILKFCASYYFFWQIVDYLFIWTLVQTRFIYNQTTSPHLYIEYGLSILFSWWINTSVMLGLKLKRLTCILTTWTHWWHSKKKRLKLLNKVPSGTALSTQNQKQFTINLSKRVVRVHLLRVVVVYYNVLKKYKHDSYLINYHFKCRFIFYNFYIFFATCWHLNIK